MSNIINIIYNVIVNDDNWVYERDELSYAMEFAKKKNGRLIRLVTCKDGGTLIDKYDFKNLCWED